MYEAFPEHAPVDCLRISGATEVDAYGRAPREANVCRATLDWLCESGYLRCKDSSKYVCMATLTPKGLECLKAVPSSLEGSTPIGERILGMVKNGSKQPSAALVRTLLSEGVRMMT
jgi:hypothetical protein